MFDLEQSIADWRRQMLAAGIKTPVPLEEMESHLREEIDQQMKSGSDSTQAFRAAAKQIGPHDILQMEFAKNSDSSYWFSDDKAATNRLLGVLWFAQCTWFLIVILSSPAVGVMILYLPHYWSYFEFVSAILGSAGVFGSIFLFCGAKLGRYVIRSLAVFCFLLGILECVTQDGSFAGTIPRYWFGILSVFSLITIWLLHLPKDTKRNSEIAPR